MILALLMACTSPDAGGSSPATGTDPCGSGTWGNLSGTLFVDASAASGGDGSQDAPFATIGDAVEVAGGSDVIVIAAGTYRETLSLGDRDLTLAGRCADRVTIDGKDAPELPVIAFNAPLDGETAEGAEPGTGTLDLSGLTLTGGDVRGLVVGGGTLQARDLLVRDIYGQGIWLERATATLEDVRIEDGGALEWNSGGGLAVSEGSQVTARRLSITRQQGLAIGAGGADTVLELEDSEIVETAPAEDLRSAALFAVDATVRLRDVRVADSHVMFGILAQWDAVVEVDGLTMQGIVGWECPDGGCTPALASGLMISFGGEEEHGGRITGSGVRITDSDNGIWSLDRGEIALTDVYVADLGAGMGLGGLIAGRGGRIEASELVVERARGSALMAGWGGEIVLTDAEILDTQSGYSDVPLEGADIELFGVQAVVSGNGLLRLDRVRLAGVDGVGIDAQADETGTPTVELTDVTIEDVGLAGGIRTALGLVFREGTLDAERLTVRDVAGPGISVVSWSDQPASLHCTDCLIEDVALAGVLVGGRDAERPVTLDGCSISGVAPDPASGLSAGLLTTNVSGPPSLQVTGCEIGDTQHGALVVSGEGAIQVHDSTLHGGSGATLGGGLDVHGNAVYATGIGPWDGSAGLLIEGSDLVPGAGETVLLHAASATLQEVAWEGGTLRQQRCEDVAPVVGADQAETFVDCPGTDLLVVDIDAVPIGMPPIEGLF
ncbi:MAG: hypothetical protein H6742_09510 [Alphaproteobacteria bacterium]|nr:hypothetical protein [Alphaproteobacteria bacterium]